MVTSGWLFTIAAVCATAALIIAVVDTASRTNITQPKPKPKPTKIIYGDVEDAIIVSNTPKKQ